jgi:hypothetical protein
LIFRIVFVSYSFTGYKDSRPAPEASGAAKINQQKEEQNNDEECASNDTG